MSEDSVQEHLGGMTNAQLLETLEQVKEDLNQAATEQSESEWHCACFAAFIQVSEEVQKRGLVTVH